MSYVQVRNTKEKNNVQTKLLRLYNTLVTVETKGESTKTMADCLRYIEQMMVEAKPPEEANTNEPGNS